MKLDVALCQSVLVPPDNESMVTSAEEPNRLITYREVDIG